MTIGGQQIPLPIQREDFATWQNWLSRLDTQPLEQWLSMGETVSHDLGDLTALASRHMAATTSSLGEVDRTVQELHSERKQEAEGVAGACSKIGVAHENT